MAEAHWVAGHSVEVLIAEELPAAAVVAASAGLVAVVQVDLEAADRVVADLALACQVAWDSQAASDRDTSAPLVADPVVVAPVEADRETAALAHRDIPAFAQASGNQASSLGTAASQALGNLAASVPNQEPVEGVVADFLVQRAFSFRA